MVFDHPTISCFIERVGREAIFHGLNDELFRLGLLSPEMYADSSLVKANVNRHQLSRSGLAVEEFRERAIEEKGLFVLNDSGVDQNGMEWEETKYCQDSKGHLPLSPVDTDARWRANSASKPPELNCQDNAIVVFEPPASWRRRWIWLASAHPRHWHGGAAAVSKRSERRTDSPQFLHPRQAPSRAIR